MVINEGGRITEKIDEQSSIVVGSQNAIRVKVNKNAI
jgi:hypothetical protein